MIYWEGVPAVVQDQLGHDLHASPSHWRSVQAHAKQMHDSAGTAEASIAGEGMAEAGSVAIWSMLGGGL